MPTDYTQIRTELAQRYFACAHCEANGEVRYIAEGRATQRTQWSQPPDYERLGQATQSAVMTDADRTLALVRCPTCGQRAPGATRWVAIRIGAWFAVAVPSIALGGHLMVVGLAMSSVLGTIQAYRERSRFNRARGAVITKLVPGKLEQVRLPEKKPVIAPRRLAPPPQLPAARVVHARPATQPEPLDVAAGPRFLGETEKS